MRGFCRDMCWRAAMGLTPGKRNSGKRCKAPVVSTRGTNTGQSQAESQSLSALPAKTKNELGPIDGALAKRDRQGKGDAATEAVTYSTPWHVRWIA